MSPNTHIFSFFSGAGFLDLGFKLSGFEVCFVNELNPDFIAAYKHSMTKMKIPHPRYGFDQASVRSYFSGRKKEYLKKLINESRREADFIGFIGGPPCPDFATGGLNQGRYGSNGILSSAYINLIIQNRPDFFVFENVKGLYFTKKHRDYFESLKTRLHKAGFVTSERLLNALEYGAPQHRERLLFVGFQKQKLRKLHFENHILNEEFVKWDFSKKFLMDEISQCSWPSTSPFRNRKTNKPANIIAELTIEDWFAKNKVDKHPNAAHFFVPKSLDKFRKLPEGNVSGKSFKRLHRWKFSPAACYGNNEVHLHPYQPRRLSVAEALAIQSLPKNFSLPSDMPLTKMFKTIGNGVPFLMAKGVAETVSSMINQISD